MQTATLCLRLLAFIALCTVACSHLSAQENPRATVSPGSWQERTISGGNLAGKTQRSRDAAFDVGAVPYSIRYVAAVDETDPTRAIPIEGCIGMPGPSSENWYHSGFLFIRVNGEDIATTALSSMLVAESGERAILDLVWHHPLASVRARFVGLPGDPALYTEIAIEPRQPITSVDITARCYPSFFTAWHKRQGARRVRAAGSPVSEGETKALPAGENWWLAYYDEIFDTAKGEGVGPCAVMVMPEQAAEVRLQVGGYAVDTTVSYPATTRGIRLGFWDFTGRTNAEVLAAMAGEAARARHVLATTDLTPASLRTFDLAATREAVRRALETPAVREQLAGKVETIQAWLQAAEPALTARPEVQNVAATEKLLQSVEAFNSFVWEVRLAELLAGM